VAPGGGSNLERAIQRPRTDQAVELVDRTITQLAFAASRLPDAPGLLTPTNRLVLEAVRERDGTVRVLAPLTVSGA
jgi:hypothetical protein